jgi:hypothetical protein
MKKCKALEVEPTPKKIGVVKRRKGASSWAGDKTSEQELLPVKPLKPSKKFAGAGTKARSLGLRDIEKASARNAEMHLTISRSGEAVTVLRLELDVGIEDYELLRVSNSCLLESSSRTPMWVLED